ncbi:peroxiredoxin [Hephaestia sp. GCM10023244]|uniref:peroxiredoxin n=1 Tax=unclassified Hephaestia TaxID=2631281 RepID=UPI002077400D|nr:peroxiredoxin [Hephaestia sp. MAHUQ-44]MCM8730981.1 peroxiredoxin [Hephaestia sp. MAHUQ-44]
MRFTVAALAALLVAFPAGAALDPGARAPDFTTRGAIAGEVVTIHLADQLKKGPVVLYFFPAAFTSGCNAEAHAFAERIGDFTAAGATVIGMSADDVETLAKFSTQKCAGKFAVASAGPRVVAGYDVDIGKKVAINGAAPRQITSRTSYVIAPDGRIIYAHSESAPDGHISGTLAAVKAWRAAHPR